MEVFFVKKAFGFLSVLLVAGMMLFVMTGCNKTTPPPATTDKTYVIYPGAGHTLDFEPDRGRYLADMLGWLSDRFPSGSPGPTGGGVP